MMKKIISILLIVAILVSGFSFTAYADTDTIGFIDYEIPVAYASNRSNARSSTRIIESRVYIEDFKELFLKNIAQCKESIDITNFNLRLNNDNMDAIQDYIWHSLPEAFNVWGIGFSYRGTLLVSVNLSYRDFSDTPKEYAECRNKMTTAADKILNGIEDNSELDDVQKALLLHDRLALWNEYDYDRLNTDAQEIYTAYAALGERKSVCQGYAMAYMYLLNRVGIENYYCSSSRLNHGWNIVYINGKSYHVDVTWDDADWGTDDRGLVGGVGHKNFLRSSYGIYSTGHEAFDYDFSPSDSTYDYYFWQNSETSFEYLNNEIYYIDNISKEIKKYSNKAVLYSFEEDWLHYLNDGRYYNFDNHAMLASDGKSLLFSTPKGIYKYNVANGDTIQVYDANLGGNLCVYGMALEDGYIICDINDAPPNYYGFNYKNKYQVKVKYENFEPKVVGIEIATAPDKTDYKIGEELIVDGLSINLIYNDDTKVKITDGFIVTGFESNTAGNKTVTVVYGDFSATFVVIVKEEVKIEYGDTNGDGKINGRDYAVLIQYINGSTFDITLENADVNLDGKINGRDYALLIQYINGWAVTLGPKA